MNVILSFLSPVHINYDKETQTSEISLAKYTDIGGDGLGNTHMTNESGLRYVLQNMERNESLDAYIAVASEKFRTEKISGVNQTKTHKEYFEERFNDVLAMYNYGEKAADIVKYINFYEYGSKEDTVKAVTSAVHEINQIRKDGDGKYKNVNVYLDISGGMRDSNMLILIISRILGNNEGIKIKDVIYSNFNSDTKEGKVEKMTDVYELLDLVAGVNEFISFGSMKTLNEYFNRPAVKFNVGKELQELLQAMTDFTGKVKLCRSTVFDEAIMLLKKKLDAFENYYQCGEHNMTEKLFSGLLTNIHDKYDMLFKEQKTEEEKYVYYIKWCHENGYLQQCLTMITERFPEICFCKEKALLEFTDENREAAVRAKFLESEEKDPAGFYNWLMFDYRYLRVDDVLKNDFETYLDSFFAEIKQSIYDKNSNFESGVFQEKMVVAKEKYMQSKIKKKTKGNVIDSKEKVAKFMRIMLRDEIFSKLRKGKFSSEDLKNKIRDFNKDASTFGYIEEQKFLSRISCFAQYVLEKRFLAIQDIDMAKPVLDYLDKNNILAQCGEDIHTLDDIVKLIVTGNNKYFKALKYDELVGCKFRRYTGNAVTMLALLEDKILTARYSVVKELIISYYELKDERNAASHANIGRNDSTSFAELNNKIKNFIDNLEKIFLYA